MKKVLDKLEDLSNQSNQIILYKVHDVKNIYKGIGKIMGKFDAELLEFLKFTNGAGVFDYCFMGFKNNKLGVNLDGFMLELWPSNTMLAGRFMPFMSTSYGYHFGYLIDFDYDNGKHPVAFVSDEYPTEVYIIASSFSCFMDTFLSDVEKTISENPTGIIISMDDENWPLNFEHWFKNDKKLEKMYQDGTISKYFDKHMPLAYRYFN